MGSEQQIQRFMTGLKRLEEQSRDGPFDPNTLAKWRILNRLHERSETIYYKVLISNIEEYAPIVYTPTVGLVCQNHSGLFRRPRGMHFSSADRGEMMSMVYNWPAEQVDMIVVTDGSRILGLGDLGIHGIVISVGKLDLYVAAAGINPQRVLAAYSCFEVGRRTNVYQIIDHPSVISFIPTTIVEVLTSSPVINLRKFILQLDHLQTLANRNLEPPMLLKNVFSWEVQQRRFSYMLQPWKGLKKKELSTIGDLHTYLSNSKTRLPAATKVQAWMPNLDYQLHLPSTRFMRPGELKKLMKQICQALKTKKRTAHTSDCFKSIKPSSLLSLCVI